MRRGSASEVTLPRNCLFVLGRVKKHQKCKFIPRLLSMIVGLLLLYNEKREIRVLKVNLMKY